MKHQAISILLLLMSSILVNAQFVVNDGAQIVVLTNSNFIIDGDYVAEANGKFANMGTVGITGSWTNNTISAVNHYESSGHYNFFGHGEQVVQGAGKAVFSNVLLNNHLKLDAEVVLLSSVTFNGNKLEVLEKDLFLGDSIQFFGVNNQAYIVAVHAGEIKKLIGEQAGHFPVGDSSALFQLAISNSGDADTIGVRIISSVLNYGIEGVDIPELDHCVNSTWVISEQNPGGSNFSFSASWPVDAENEFFARTNCGLGVYDGSWRPQVSGAALGNDPFCVTREYVGQLSALAVGDSYSPMAMSLDLCLDVTVFLEGPFNEGAMVFESLSDDLPLSQPFNCEPWNYNGTETLDSIPETGVVDWILVDVRDTTSASLATSASTVYRRAGLLLASGSIVDLDGHSGINCPVDSVKHDFFIALFHRNHLAVLSSQPLVELNGVYTYNFSTSNVQAYGTDSQKPLDDNLFGMYAGDIDGNGIIDFQDLETWQNNAAGAGYLNSDINLDGQIDNKDKNLLWYYNQQKQSQIPDLE